MKAISRRRFLQIAALAGGATMLPMPVRWLGTGDAQAFYNSLPLGKWMQPIRNLTALGDASGIPCLTPKPDPYFVNTDLYEVTAAQFTDTLHPNLGPTTLWGYHETAGPTNPNPPKRHLGGVIIATRGRASRIRFTNTLPPTHIIPVDTSVPGANQAQNRIAVHLHGGYIPWMSDGGPFDWWAPNGGSGAPGSTGLSFQNGKGSMFDTLTDNAMTNGQADYYYPNDQSTRLMWYHDHAHGITRINAYAGLATGYLVLDPAQDAKINPGMVPPLTSTIPLVFQDKIFVGPGTAASDPTWASVVQKQVDLLGNTIFDPAALGSLWYAHLYEPALYRQKKGLAYRPPPNPSCVPEFFADTMLCNGLVSPFVPVEPKRYRFLILNACNARFLNINLLKVQAGAEIVTDPVTLLPKDQVLPPAAPGGAWTPVSSLAPTPPTPGPAIIRIGSEGGYLAKEVSYPNTNFINVATFTGNMLLGNAERADIIIDFSNAAAGDEFVFYNDAPGPFPVGAPTNDHFAGNPATPWATHGNSPDTRQILRFKVGPLTSAADPQPIGTIFPSNLMDPTPLTAIPAAPVAPVAPLAAPAGATIRNLTLNEDFDPYGRLRQLLGTTKPALVSKGFGLEYLASPTEITPASRTEVWRIFNLTGDTHPIHFHLQNCQVLSRQPFKLVSGIFVPTGVARGPELDELCWKETVRMNPGEVTTVTFKWDMPPVPFAVPTSNRIQTMGLAQPGPYNEYVWHCHILEHEEHDMMRPLIVTGQNPQRPNILPTAYTIPGSSGGSRTFTVSVAAGASFTVNSNSLTITPSNVLASSFDVVVAAATAAQQVTFTVTDSNGLTSSVILTIT